METLTHAAGRDVTVLLADDDPRARQGISLYFRGCAKLCPSLRVRCLEAGSAKEAMAAFGGTSVGFVFLDYHMPDMDGLDCLSRMLDGHPDLPITLLTGDDSAMLAAEAIKRGACDYVVKSEASVEEIHRTLWKGLEWTAMRRKIRAQAGQLLEAENQRVMMESLAAACHHLGQPATVIETCVALLKRERDPEQIQKLLDDAQGASDRLGEILKRMEGLRAYRTEPYLTQGFDSPESVRMLVL